MYTEWQTLVNGETYAIATVTPELFREALDFEDVVFCAKCESAFAPVFPHESNQCYKCTGYTHDHARDYKVIGQ